MRVRALAQPTNRARSGKGREERENSFALLRVQNAVAAAVERQIGTVQAAEGGKSGATAEVPIRVVGWFKRGRRERQGAKDCALRNDRGDRPALPAPAAVVALGPNSITFWKCPRKGHLYELPQTDHFRFT